MFAFGIIGFAVGCREVQTNQPVDTTEQYEETMEINCTDHANHGKSTILAADTYANFAATEAVSAYSKQWRTTSSTTIISTPHGGGIEAGTTEICDSVAVYDYDFYSFTGLKTPNSGNATLQITSVNFDEPKGNELIQAASKAHLLHGKADNNNEIVYVGGRDAALRTKVKSELEAEGFTAIIDTTSSISGQAKANFTNRTTSEKGCQLEITTKLRQKLMSNLFNGPTNRMNSRTVHFTKFVRALRKAVQ
jgi:phage replication-related protein YjqB (UPF0714/DUF867 family)